MGGTIAIQSFQNMDMEGQFSLMAEFGTHYLDMVSNISKIIVERTSENLPSDDEVPLVAPHELVKMTRRHFCSILQRQVPRLRQHYNQREIQCIEDDFINLKRCYQRERITKAALDACDAKTPFLAAWNKIPGRFLYLRSFCGGLGTVFPGTSTVESDFSIVKWEKDDCRVSLSDFSLEGILQAKQYKKIQKMGFGN